MSRERRGDFSVNHELIPISLMGILIGAISSVVALALLNLIRLFTNVFFYGQLSLAERPASGNHLGLWVILIPVAGSLIIGLMARFGSEKIRGHGIPEALEAILFGKSLMQPKVAVLKPLSSAISIGSGGPFGAEGPIIMTGGAFGSILAQAFHLTSAERKTLLVAGAAAGMSAVFATPIAAVLLAVELLLFEWKPRSLVPVALAAITAAGIRPLLIGTGPLFPLQTHTQTTLALLACAGAVGIAAGAFSSLVTGALYKLEDAFAKLPIHWMWWPALGGLVVGIGGYFKPRVLGVGYDVIEDLLQNRIPLGSTVALVGTKALVWVFALASGTSGGVLAPLLIMGSALGSIEGAFLPAGSGSLWALVSMAAILGGMMRSPFTACLFALELTHDETALPPLLAAAILAYAFTALCMKRSILTEKVARRGYDVFREYSVDPLERLRVSQAMTKEVVCVPADLDLRALQRDYFQSKSHAGFPVLASDGSLAGIVTRSDLLKADPARVASPFARVIDIASTALQTTTPDASCREAAEQMAKYCVGRLAVVARGRPEEVVGIVTRSDLLKARFHALQEEQVRERHLAFGALARSRRAP